MREIARDVTRWIEEGKSDIAIATVLRVFGSAPRKEGAKLACRAAGGLSGSISGGCVESAIIEEALSVIEYRTPRIIHFDTTDDEAWEVGLPCGGSIDVLVEPINVAVFSYVCRLIEKNERSVELTIIDSEESLLGRKLVADSSDGRCGDFPPELTEKAETLIRGAEVSGRQMLTQDVEVFVDVVKPVPTLVAVGGVHIAIALSHMARELGFRTVVIDPRGTFGSPERFPLVDELLTEWPQNVFGKSPPSKDTALIVLTHDPKLDDPALEAALSSEAFYVGALGSVRTQNRRRQRLLERGFSEAALERIHGPVGLDIGAATPEEIALSILAEIVAVMNGKDGNVGRGRPAATGRGVQH